MAVVMAIDTSNYTSSISVLNDKKILSDKRQLLTVGVGKRGLQQSEAVFQHLKHLPILMEQIKIETGNINIDAIGVASRPRPVKSSYMPVFATGENFALFLSNFLGVPLYRFSHQEGHIESMIYSMDLHLKNEFLCLHLSGGTTEVLKVKIKEQGFDIEIVGGTQDISAGQFIDRIGVKMGYNFPCGRAIDELSLMGDSKNLQLSPSTKGTFMSFSGPETAVQKFLLSNKHKEDICASVMENISLSLNNTINRCMDLYNVNHIVFAGGVASSRYLRERLFELFKNRDCSIYFGDPLFCSDNSIGIASMTMKAFSRRR